MALMSGKMLLRSALACALAATLAGCAHVGRSDAAPPSLEEMIPALLKETGVPSVAVGKVENRRPAWSRAWGEQSAGVPATRDTLYNVASLTKPITAETVLRAAARGRLRLDEPMFRWWVDPDIAADARHQRLTPRLALTHRTGFPNWRHETGGRLGFRSDPGGLVGYSGEGFEYLARYAERRTKVSFETLAEELVFRPAGMQSTAYSRRAWFEGRIAVPTAGDGTALVPSIGERFVASDDLYTTAGDYVRFLAGVAGHAGLDRAAAAERARIQVSTLKPPCPGAAHCPDMGGWGLGWDVAQFGDDQILWHTGADRGEFTFAYIIPRTGEGGVILTNSAVGYKVVLPILEAIGTHRPFLAYLRAQAG